MFINRKILKWGGIFLLVALVIFGVYSILEWKTYEQEVSSLSPEEMAERVIRENVKEEFLPKEYYYKVVPYSEIIEKFKIKETTGAPLPPFPGTTTDLYLTAWVKDNVWFTSYIGYDKETGNFIGYDISARVKEPKLKGPELAQKFFKNISQDNILNKWRHGASESEMFGTKREVYSIVFRKGLNKVFLQSRVSEYATETTVHWPKEDRARKIGLVWMDVLTPSNPNYSGVEQLLKDSMEGYEEE